MFTPFDCFSYFFSADFFNESAVNFSLSFYRQQVPTFDCRISERERDFTSLCHVIFTILNTTQLDIYIFYRRLFHVCCIHFIHALSSWLKWNSGSQWLSRIRYVHSEKKRKKINSLQSGTLQLKDESRSSQVSAIIPECVDLWICDPLHHFCEMTTTTSLDVGYTHWSWLVQVWQVFTNCRYVCVCPIRMYEQACFARTYHDLIRAIKFS